MPKTRSTKVSFGSRRGSLPLSPCHLRPCTSGYRPGSETSDHLLHSGELTTPPKKPFRHSDMKRLEIYFILLFFFRDSRCQTHLVPRYSIVIMNSEQQIGAYVNSLTPATNLLASGRNSYQNSSSQLPSAEEASRCLQEMF